MSDNAPIETRPYILRSSPMAGEGYAGVSIDESGNFMAATHGKPRALAAMLRMIADEIELDEQWGGDPNAGVLVEGEPA
jgi:hypothetical protein